MDEGIVKRGKDTGDTENELSCTHVSRVLDGGEQIEPTISGQRAERDVLVSGSVNLLLGRHFGRDILADVVDGEEGKRR